MLIRALSIGMVVAIAAAAPSLAEEVVYFQNGQAMRVEKTRREGRWLFLELATDGEMAVLMRQIKKVEEAEALAGNSGGGSAVANVVSATSGPAIPASRAAAVAASYDTMRSGEEPGVVPDLQAEDASASAVDPSQATPPALQGQDLVPRTFPRGGRRNPNRFPRQ